jgi:CheR methyltransferase, SAM binding domain
VDHVLPVEEMPARQDLICCRNVMIYLGQDLQRKIIPLFHYALRPGGYLCLGPSESASSHGEMFETIDKKQRLFQRKEVLPRPVISFPLAEVHRSAPAGGKRYEVEEPNIPKQLERIILQRYRPACVTVKENGDAVYFSGRISRYLEQPTLPKSLRERLQNLAERFFGHAFAGIEFLVLPVCVAGDEIAFALHPVLKISAAPFDERKA